MASIDEAKEIIKGNPISSIISFYIPINKKGGNFEAICPFHGDSHPSLKINDSKGIYKCFACGAAGDSIEFVKNKLHLEYVDAIKDIAGHLGLSIEEKQNKHRNPKYEMGLRVLKAANKLYRKVAIEKTPDSFHDFVKKRKLNEDSLKNFQIGYAPKASSLTHYLNSIPEKERKLAIESAKEIGIIRNSKSGQGQYDFFRDRITFPIWDHSGKVRGFSTRAVRDDQVPKYLNSGESFIFDKSHILYGFNLAKASIREKDHVIIVEGNMDAVTLHQFGFKASVATMGVALGQSNVRLLTNMTKNIFLAMDSDPAGIKAMERINNDFLALDIIPKFISFSPAKDPDEFLHEYGRLELIDRIEKAPTFLDFLINENIPKSIPESTDQKLKILRKTFEIISPVKSRLFAQEKAIAVAKTLGLRSSNEDIVQEFKNFLEQNQKPTSNKVKTDTYTEPPVEIYEDHPVIYENDFLPPTENTSVQVSKVEKLVLETFLMHPDCILDKQITEILDKIEHYEVKRIVQWLEKIYLEIDEADYVVFVQEKMKEALPDDIKSIMASSIFNYTDEKLDKGVKEKLLFDLSKKLDESHLKNKRQELIKKQSEALTDADGLTILQEIQQVEMQLLALRQKK